MESGYSVLGKTVKRTDAYPDDSEKYHGEIDQISRYLMICAIHPVGIILSYDHSSENLSAELFS